MKNVNNKLLFYFLTGTMALFLFFIFSPNAFAETFILNNITENTTWTPTDSPYIVENSIDIATNKTLTILPGTVVKFEPTNNVSINVLGNLVANGETDNKIYFTSNYDDTVGGDTDGDYYCYDDVDEDGNFLGEICDGSGYVPDRSDWGGIFFFHSSNSSFKNSVLRYANNTIELNYSNLDLEKVEISDSNSGISAYQNNEVSIDGGNFHDIKKDVLLAYDFSSFSAKNINIKDIHQDAISIFTTSDLDISDSSIKNVLNGDAISVFGGSVLDANNLEIKDVSGDNAISLFNNSHLSIKNSNLKNCPSTSCVQFFDGDPYFFIPSSVEASDSIFDGGDGSGFLTFGNSNILTKINKNTIKNFSNFAVENYSPTFIVNAKNNFWGNDTGPFHPDKNPTGTAGIVYDNVNFVPWCTTSACHFRNPVILIPGIMGSEILKNYDDNSEIWPNANKLVLSITDGFMDDLALNIDGTENSAKLMKLGDIIRGTTVNILGIKYVSHTFDGLINELEANGYEENQDLFVFPYDWRKSNIENAVLLKNKIDEILTQTGDTKVDIIAHSMGGLLAKRYIYDNSADKVDKLIFIGTPHLGAPKAFKALMYGDDMTIHIGRLSLLSPNEVKKISQNMPSVFELLPSRKYVNGEQSFLGEKYVTDMVTPYYSKPGSHPNLDLDFDGTESYLLRQGKNPLMIPYAENLHDSIDDLDLSRVNMTNFSGCGSTKTIGRVIVKKKKSFTSLWQKFVDDYEVKYTNGDDTVPLQSSILQSGKRYYVKGFTHGELPSADGLKEDIISILKNKEPQDFDDVSTNIDDCYISGKTVSIHSLDAVETHVYDKNGKHTGPVKNNPNPGNNHIEYGIPGVQYDQIGGNTYIFLPTGGGYQIINSAVNTGAYDLNIENVNANDTETGSVSYNDIVVNDTDTNSEIDLPSSSFDDGNLNPPPVLNIDENGDGTFEQEIPPSVILDQNQTGDHIPPATIGTISGNLILLEATDDNSGVLETDYSLDDGITWVKYEDPIKINSLGIDTKTIQYFSTDNAGNIESINTLDVPIRGENPNVQNYGHSGGNILILNSSQALPKTKETSSISENTNLLSNKNVIKKDFKNIVSKEIIKQKTDKKKNDNSTQTATVLNSNIKFNKIWFIIIGIGFVLGILAKKYLKR